MFREAVQRISSQELSLYSFRELFGWISGEELPLYLFWIFVLVECWRRTVIILV